MQKSAKSTLRRPQDCCFPSNFISAYLCLICLWCLFWFLWKSYDLENWLKGDDKQPPPPPERLKGRNSSWHKFFFARDILTIPVERIWLFFFSLMQKGRLWVPLVWWDVCVCVGVFCNKHSAAWDLAFQCIALSEIDLESAKSQLVLLLREWYMGANGGIPLDICVCVCVCLLTISFKGLRIQFWWC